MNAEKGPSSWGRGDACEKWAFFVAHALQSVCVCDESKSEGCLVSAIDCANDSSSRQPLITPLTDSGAGGGSKRGEERASLAGWCTKRPQARQNVSQEPVDGSIIAAHAAMCCSKRQQRAQPGEQLWVHRGEAQPGGRGGTLGSGRDGLGGGLGADSNHISQCSKAPPCVHIRVYTGKQPGEQKFHAEQVKQGETSAEHIWNTPVLLPTLVLRHEGEK